MSEVRFNLLDSQRSIHATIHGSTGEAIVAALSADPETIEELEAALERFRPGDAEGYFGRCWSRGTCEEPWDAGIVVVDLAARLVASESTYSYFDESGSVLVRKGDVEAWVNYHVAGDWCFRRGLECWESTARERRAERARTPRVDPRPVLYDGVLPFVVEECRAVADAPPDSEELYDVMSAIHARWLGEPHPELNGRPPRDVLLERSLDIQFRRDQWSRFDECPPGLEPNSAAHRFGGFGTHEIVVYYDLVRHLLWECWDRTTGADGARESVEERVAWLEGRRDAWLRSPNEDLFSGRAPAEVIERERLRLPMAISGEEAIVDHDCPLCQMQAELPGPVFWILDGCHMDDAFEFSFHRTREEWDAEQREWEELSRKWESERAEREANGEREATIWKSSHSDSGPPNLFGIGAHLGELVTNLKDAGEEWNGLVNLLNRGFGNLREAASGESTALIGPVADKLAEELDTVADQRPELAERCHDLQRRVRAYAVRRENGEPEWDDEVPF